MAWFMSGAINVRLAGRMSRLRAIWPNPSSLLDSLGPVEDRNAAPTRAEVD